MNLIPPLRLTRSVAALALLVATLSSLHPAEAPRINLSEKPISKDTKLATSLAPVIKRVVPSVVNIYTTKTVRDSWRGAPNLDDPVWRRFFGLPPDEDDGESGGRPRSRQEQNLGSGVIVSEDGYILTNSHVVDGAEEIRIVLSDGKREMEARIVGTDPSTEIAVLKVEGSGFAAIQMTDSDHLEVGDLALAVGNPFGVGQTVTMGIVSATGRGGFGIVNYEDFIQTDASINPGNSGGALVDAEGRLIGINTAIFSRSGGNQGVGFAVPVNIARMVLERLVTDGKVTRGFLGVLPRDLSPELARRFGVSDTRGALIAEVSSNTPAEKAGLLVGDVILEVNGRKVEGARQLRLMVSQTQPGTRITLEGLRDGKPKSFNVTLADLDESQTARRTRGIPRPESGQDTLDGVAVADLDSSLRQRYNIPDEIRGAVVTRVDPDSKSARTIRPGDVLLEIERKEVKNADDAVRLGKGLEGGVLVRLWRQGGSTYVVVGEGSGGR